MMRICERFGLDKYFAIGIAIGCGVAGVCVAVVRGIAQLVGGA